jgi:hypothetical protein
MAFSSIDDFDPFQFVCDFCSTSKIFTEPEIERIKQKTPGTVNNYFILCQSCKKGHMQPPTFIASSGFFE